MSSLAVSLRLYLIAVLVFALGVSWSLGDSKDPPLPNLSARAPHEVLARGLDAPVGVAVAADGRIFFTDEKKGSLFEISGAGAPRLLTNGLDKPQGLLWEGADRVLVVAEGLKPDRDKKPDGPAPRGLLLRFDLVSGRFTILADGLKRPRGLVRAEGGIVYVSADGLRVAGERAEGEHEDEEDEDAETNQGTVFRWSLATGLQVVARGFKHPDGLALRPDGTVFVAAERFKSGEQRLEGSVFRIDPAGSVAVHFPDRLKHPAGLLRDQTGALFVGGERPGEAEGRFRGVLVKLREEKPAAEFATGLDRPRGMALSVEGHLVAADDKAGVVLRFRAPLPPRLNLPNPAFTKQDPFPVTGTAERSAESLVLGGREKAAALSGSDGAFDVLVPLSHNQQSNLLVFAIGSGGQGLASAPAPTAVIHDDIPPVITASLDRPPNAAGWHNADVTVGFTCSDGGSGIASCSTPVVVTAEGANQTVTGTAIDRAGNAATARASLNIDKTPPVITAGPSPAPNAAGWNNTDVTVTFDAQDALSGIAGSSSPVTITTEGAAQFVTGTATDRAGNVATAFAGVSIDKTPPVVTITAPAAGTVRRVPRIEVSGTATESNDLVSLSVGGVTVSPALLFSAEVSLQPGPQTLSVVALDVAGNGGAASVDVVFTPPPSVKITSPPDLSAFGTTPISVSGTIGDAAATVKVGIEGVLAVVTGNTWAATGLSLREGGNVITAVATDALGNAATDSITVVLDTAAPRVAIDSPPTGSMTTSPTITVAGRVNDVVIGTVNTPQASVTVNGIPATVSQRTFIALGVALVSGINTITATARDAVGNMDSVTTTVILDASPGSRIRVASGDDQTAGIGEPLPQPLEVLVTDTGGAPIAGRTTIFRVSQNNGHLLDVSNQPVRGLSLTTDTQGKASARFVLGSRAGAGNNRVEVTAQGVPGSADFVISAQVHPPAKINVDSGGGQKGVVGQPLPRPFVAVVTDEGHNRLSGIPVTFTVVDGNGDFNGQPATTVTTDSDGRALAVVTLGPRAGIENNVVSASAENLAGLPAAFSASSFEPGDPAATKISGVVLDNTNVAVPGVTLRVRGTAMSATADTQGQFVINGAPVGDVHLEVDGSTAQRPGTWPNLEYELVTVPGADNTLGMPIYLLPLDTVNGIFVDETHGGTLTLPDYPGFSLTIAPNSALFPDGTRRGTVTVTVVHVDKVPMVPNFGQQPRFIVTIQPPGVRFDPPAQVTHPNVDGLAPGEVTELYSFDHDMGSFIATGTARVSEDGLMLVSDEGTGIIKGGWHCGGNPNTSGTANQCPSCAPCDGTVCVPETSLPTPPNVSGCCDGVRYDSQIGCCVNNVLQDKHPPDPTQCKFTFQDPDWQYEFDGCTSVPDNPAGGSDTYFSNPSCSSQFPGFCNRPCDFHDICYQTCNPNRGHAYCDDLFLQDALAVCAASREPFLVKVECRRGAYEIWAGLRAIGSIAFGQRQRQVCQCCP